MTISQTIPLIVVFLLVIAIAWWAMAISVKSNAPQREQDRLNREKEANKIGMRY